MKEQGRKSVPVSIFFPNHCHGALVEIESRVPHGLEEVKS